MSSTLTVSELLLTAASDARDLSWGPLLRGYFLEVLLVLARTQLDHETSRKYSVVLFSS